MRTETPEPPLAAVLAATRNSNQTLRKNVLSGKSGIQLYAVFLQSDGAPWENTYRVEQPKVKIWQVVHQRAIYRHTNELDFIYEVVVKAFLIFWWTVTL